VNTLSQKNTVSKILDVEDMINPRSLDTTEATKEHSDDITEKSVGTNIEKIGNENTDSVCTPERPSTIGGESEDLLAKEVAEGSPMDLLPDINSPSSFATETNINENTNEQVAELVTDRNRQGNVQDQQKLSQNTAVRETNTECNDVEKVAFEKEIQQRTVPNEEVFQDNMTPIPYTLEQDKHLPTFQLVQQNVSTNPCTIKPTEAQQVSKEVAQQSIPQNVDVVAEKTDLPSMLPQIHAM
jgi:hypothetical protein